MRGLLFLLGQALLNGGRRFSLLDGILGPAPEALREVEAGKGRRHSRNRRACFGSRRWRAYKNRVAMQRRSRRINQGRG